MKDMHDRNIHYLRLSVTDKCNLRCVYCMPESGVTKLKHEDILSVEEIAEIVRASATCGITKVRVTGGEPLVRRGIVNICERIAQTDGIHEVCLTTNGILLPQFVNELKAVGVNRLNISLDSLERSTYSEITRVDALNTALEGIDIALKSGFDAIKINAVLMGGINDTEILNLLNLTRKNKVNLRLIELMPVGECADWAEDKFIPAASVLELAPTLREVGTDGVSKLYMLPDGLGTIGLISPISSHFCPTCNRIRVTCDGFLKPCLHSKEEINLRGLSGKELEQVIRSAIYNKPRKHELDSGETSDAARNMNAIGG